MFERNITKKIGDRTTPMFLKGMFFYIHMDDISIRSESCSIQTRKIEALELVRDSQYKDLIGIDLLVKLCEDQNRLIHEQTQEIEILENRLGDYEEEIYQKEYKNEIENQANVSEVKIYDD